MSPRLFLGGMESEKLLIDWTVLFFITLFLLFRRLFLTVFIWSCPGFTYDLFSFFFFERLFRMLRYEWDPMILYFFNPHSPLFVVLLVGRALAWYLFYEGSVICDLRGRWKEKEKIIHIDRNVQFAGIRVSREYVYYSKDRTLSCTLSMKQ